MGPDLEAALARMDAALDRLSGAVSRHLDPDLRRGDLETELQVMGEDRVRLATELESAAARVARLEAAASHLSPRIEGALATIEAVLAAEATAA